MTDNFERGPKFDITKFDLFQDRAVGLNSGQSVAWSKGVWSNLAQDENLAIGNERSDFDGLLG